MKLITNPNKLDLNNFLNKNRASFLQSYEWGERQVAGGIAVKRLAVVDDQDDILSCATLLEHRFAGFKYYYCPAGPVIELRIENRELRVLEFLFGEIEKIAREDNAIFLRFEPADNDVINKLTGEWQIKKTINLQPRKTRVLDLKLDEKKLLSDMKQKTRYNINLAQKHGVKIVVGDEKDFNDFWQLMKQTSDRDKFNIHSKQHYQDLLKLDFVKLLLAKHNNKTVASGLFVFFNNTATYLHGGSSSEDRQLMAPYLLQWEAIKLAKQQGCEVYDFFGIDEKKWPGVSRFKEGFGGEVVEKPGTFDLVFNGFWYFVYGLARKVRRIF